MKREEIARVCHQVNKAYCEAMGDHSQPDWNDAPKWQKDSAMMGVNLHSEKDVGPEASHESWMKQKVEEGWVYGALKDPVAKTHFCIVPFHQLSKEQQAKDFIFREVVHALRPTSPAKHASDDKTIEQEIQAKGKTAPRVTPADIDGNIVSEHYFTADDGHMGEWISSKKGPRDSDAPAALKLLTFCVLVLQNGFTVTGESACASPENFDAVIGRKIARANAVQKIWPLMGYALKERLSA